MKGIMPAATCLFAIIQAADLAHLWATDTALLVGAVALRILLAGLTGVCLTLSWVGHA